MNTARGPVRRVRPQDIGGTSSPRVSGVREPLPRARPGRAEPAAGDTAEGDAGPRVPGTLRRTGPRLPRHRAWPRLLVLLLALLVPGSPAEVSATPVAAAELVEYDALDTVLRPPARGAHRPAVPLRPAPLTGPAPGVPESRPLPAPPRPPYALRALRTVVLRC
ncbi:hypothetical protein ACWD0J_20165 [Streptomyces sp. NPDC003011]